MFYILRFLLGAAEAGLYPCLVFYITLWLPRAYLARGVGMLTIGSAIGNGAGALISGPLLDLDGMLGLAGWQWIFLITGAIPRSEEHTSELQSLMRISYAVFCLKKKKNKHKLIQNNHTH